MRRIVIGVSASLLIFAAWFLLWRVIMADDVAQIQATIAHHHQAIKTQTPSVTLKADDVYAAGFPFRFRVAVTHPTLTQIWAMETYAVSFDKIELEKINDGEGRYRVITPDHFEALYAEDGMAPEHYTITVNPVPALLLRAQADSRQCPNMPGMRKCAPVEESSPLISFAAQLPDKLVLDVALIGKTKQIGFDFTPINVPIFMMIPSDVARPLQLFVGMLREAMVFRG